MGGEKQIAEDGRDPDKQVRQVGEKPRLRYESKRLSGPASGNREGLVAPPCKNNHKLVCDLCPPRGSVQYEDWGGGHGTLPFFRCGEGKSLQ